MPMYCCDMAGEPVTSNWAYRAQELGGAALVFMWKGEERKLESWRSEPEPDVLHYEFRQEGFQTKPGYYRSFLPAGSRRHLSVIGLRLDPSVLRKHWLQGTLPREMVEGYAWLHHHLRRLFAVRVANHISGRMHSLVPGYDAPLHVTGPTSADRELHANYEARASRIDLQVLLRADSMEGRHDVVMAKPARPGAAKELLTGAAQYLIDIAGLRSDHELGTDIHLIPGSRLYQDCIGLIALARTEVTPSRAAQAIVQSSGGQNERRYPHQAVDREAQSVRRHGHLLILS